MDTEKCKVCATITKSQKGNVMRVLRIGGTKPGML